MNPANRSHGKHGIPVIEDAAQFFGATHHLDKIDVFAEECRLRWETGKRYDALLSDIPDIRPPVITEGNTSVYAQYTILSPKRDAFGQQLKAKGVPSVAYYTAPLHLQGAFAELGYKAGDFPVSEKVAAECLSLPMSPYLSRREQEKIAKAMRNE